MRIPDWIKPANWTPETKAAARETVRVAVIFAITLFQASRAVQNLPAPGAPKMPSR